MPGIRFDLDRRAALGLASLIAAPAKAQEVAGDESETGTAPLTIHPNSQASFALALNGHTIYPVRRGEWH